jgi:hypothetical protein
MRICTLCGHKLAADEYLCPACELWNTKSYGEGRDARRVPKLATVFVGSFEHAEIVREACESSGIPAWIDSQRGGRGGGRDATVRVCVPAERAGEVAELLASFGEEEGDRPTRRSRRTRLRARLSLRRRAYQALAWSILSLVFPPAALVAGRLALKVLAENRGLPVVTEETRVASAALIISTAAMLVAGVVLWFLVKGL